MTPADLFDHRRQKLLQRGLATRTSLLELAEQEGGRLKRLVDQALGQPAVRERIETT